MTKPISIFKLQPGDAVDLVMGTGNREYTQRALFIGHFGQIEENGRDKRRARFVSVNTNPAAAPALDPAKPGYYQWEAYRSLDGKRWCFGSSAERIAVERVL